MVPGQRNRECVVCGYRQTLFQDHRGINLYNYKENVCNKIIIHHYIYTLHVCVPLIKWGKAFADNTAWTFSDVPERKSMQSIIVFLSIKYMSVIDINIIVPWAKLPRVMTASLISSLLELSSDTRLTNLSTVMWHSHKALNNFSVTHTLEWLPVIWMMISWSDFQWWHSWFFWNY